MNNWWISWDKEKHTLTWFYGDIKDCPRHPVEFVGMQGYARRNFCLVFPRIRWQEWTCLMKLRENTPQLLVRPEQEFSNRFFNDITKDVFPREYFKNEPALEDLMPLLYVMTIIQGAFKWLSVKNKEN